MKKEYKASRMTKGNFWFPARLILTETDITFQKKRMVGMEIKTIPYQQIASVVLSTGLMYGEMLIESSGGQQIIAKGFGNTDLMTIKEIIDEGRRRTS